MAIRSFPNRGRTDGGTREMPLSAMSVCLACQSGWRLVRDPLRRIPIYQSREIASKPGLGHRRAHYRFIDLDKASAPPSGRLFLEVLEQHKARAPASCTTRGDRANGIGGSRSPGMRTRALSRAQCTELRRLPIRLWGFSDGLRVVRARRLSGRSGCRVDDIAGINARQARDMVAPDSPVIHSGWITRVSTRSRRPSCCTGWESRRQRIRPCSASPTVRVPPGKSCSSRCRS